MFQTKPSHLARFFHYVLSHVCLLAGLVVITGPVNSPAATIEWLGSNTYPTGVSSNGAVVAYNFNFSGFSTAHVWRRGVGTESLEAIPPQPPYNGTSTAAYAISRDGTTITGGTWWSNFNNSSTHAPTVWRDGEVPYILPLPGGAIDYGAAGAMNDDTSMILGAAYVSFSPTTLAGVRWTVNGPTHVFGPFAGGTNASPRGISGDGAIVVGVSDKHVVIDGIPFDFDALPFVWTEQYGLQQLPGAATGGSALTISSDGTTIAGQAGMTAALWHLDPLGFTDPGGQSPVTVDNLGTLPGGTSSAATGVSADGSIVVGHSAVVTSPGTAAFLWTSQLGMVDLNTYLPTLGVDLTGAYLTNATTVSADGRTIVGYGNLGAGPGSLQGWIVTLPVPEPATIFLLALGGLALLIFRTGARRHR